MRGFELYDATTVKEAVDLLGKYSGRTVKVVGGGSDIVGGVMKDWVQGKGMPLPEVLIDITTIKDIVGIKTDGGGTTIGAATTLSAETSTSVRAAGSSVVRTSTATRRVATSATP